MAVKTYTFKVPSIVCDGCAKAITDEILTHESEAKVSVDVNAKTVNVETAASTESIKQMIESLGHTVE
jgi:copper chaperone